MALYNNGFPVNYQYQVPNYSYTTPQYGYSTMPMNQNMNQGMNNMNMNSMGNMNGNGMSNVNNMGNMGQSLMSQYSNTGNNYQLPAPATQMQAQQQNNDIVWVESDDEVFSYPVAQNCNQLFFNMQAMKMYTKEGATGLVRDFELHESPESIQRYQQMQQTQNMQFPVIDSTANVVNTEQQADALVDAIERKMEERFTEFENRFSALSDEMRQGNQDSLDVANTTTKKTTSKSMTKRGGA